MKNKKAIFIILGLAAVVYIGYRLFFSVKSTVVGNSDTPLSDGGIFSNHDVITLEPTDYYDVHERQPMSGILSEGIADTSTPLMV